MTEPFRPANGIEGAIFMAHYCDCCEHDRAYRDGTGDSCPIAAATMAFSISDPEYPKEWVRDADGARCTAFETQSTRASVPVREAGTAQEAPATDK